MMTVGGVTTAVFEAYIEHVLGPTLRPGQVVLRDNLCAHKSPRLHELVAARGCRQWYVAAYSPDFSPIELASAKIKAELCAVGARLRDGLEDAVAHALTHISPAGPALDHLRARLSPVTAAALASLVSPLQPAAPLQLTTPRDVVAALLACLRVLCDDGPLLLIRDDVQWAGKSFWELAGAFGQLCALPLLIVLAYRPEEAGADLQAQRSLPVLDGPAAPLRLTLARLEPPDCAALAVELLAAPDAGSTTLLPHSFGVAWQLPAPTSAALELAAVLGRAFSHDLSLGGRCGRSRRYGLASPDSGSFSRTGRTRLPVPARPDPRAGLRSAQSAAATRPARPGAGSF